MYYILINLGQFDCISFPKSDYQLNPDNIQAMNYSIYQLELLTKFQKYNSIFQRGLQWLYFVKKYLTILLFSFQRFKML